MSVVNKVCEKNHNGFFWSVVESFDDLNDAVSAWNTLFVDVANRHAPIKKLRTKRAIKPWITKELKM